MSDETKEIDESSSAAQNAAEETRQKQLDHERAEHMRMRSGGEVEQ